MIRPAFTTAALALALAAPAAAQEPARPAGPVAPRPAASPPVKMLVPGEEPTPRPSFGAIPATRLAIKNTTTDKLTCRLAVAGQPGRVLTFEPGQAYSDQFSPIADLALLCPQVRRAAFSPLILGSRYVFVRLDGAPQLVEVAPPDPK
jgi:hypothetical protein